MPDEAKQDITINCSDCGKDFVHSVKDQEFFEKIAKEKNEKPWSNPKRCKPCRDARKRLSNK